MTCECGHDRDEHIKWPQKFVRGQVGDRWTQCLTVVEQELCICPLFRELDDYDGDDWWGRKARLRRAELAQ